MVTIYIKYVFMKYLSQKDNFHKNINLGKMVSIFFSLDQMLLQMYENPIAGEDWQTKNVTEDNKAWF